MKKVINILVDVLVAIMIAFTIIFAVSTAQKGYTNFCGYSTIRVLSNSMSASGIKRGDVKIIRSSCDYEVGDIIAFYYDNGKETFILYHQIIEKTKEGRFITKGSSNKLPESKTIIQKNIIGKQVNNGNYKILVSIPFKVSLVISTYILTMGYIGWTVHDILEEDKKDMTKQPKKKKDKKNIVGVIICLMLMPSMLLTNNAYASEQTKIDLIQKIKFSLKSWSGSEKLTNNAYESSITLEYALNNPTSESGESLINAMNARKSKDWVGNMDTISNVSDNLEKVMEVPYGCTYIIKIKSNSWYELYITYENYEYMSIYTRFGVVYKTTFQETNNGNFEIISSESGTATVTYYDISHGQMQKSFNTDEFISYK